MLTRTCVPHGQTVCRIVVDGQTIEEILSFDYSSDVMAIAEEAHFSVENKGKRYRDKLKLGQRVEFILQNPRSMAGANGQTPRRHRAPQPKINPSEGSVINITSADLGWHIQNSDAPLWLRLQGKTYADICDPAIHRSSIRAGASRAWISLAIPGGGLSWPCCGCGCLSARHRSCSRHSDRAWGEARGENHRVRSSA